MTEVAEIEKGREQKCGLKNRARGGTTQEGADYVQLINNLYCKIKASLTTHGRS